MPVTVRPTDNKAHEWRQRFFASSSAALLRSSCPTQFKQAKEIIRSSFDQLTSEERTIVPSSNGFVNAAFEAYCTHHHLILRPEDFWFAILVQLSFYINANAETLRSFFVAHEGQKELVVREVGTRYTVDIGRLAERLTHEMDKYLNDPDLRPWIMPDFTTTTKADSATAAVIMMGAMQKYFTYTMEMTCGIPSVTLLGERDDWVKIRSRLDKLSSMGLETKRWASLLKPIADRFIKTFDAPNDPNIIDFWNRICHKEYLGSGPTYLSGWITAFCFWDADGKLQYQGAPMDEELPAYDTNADFDSSVYCEITTKKIPDSFAAVPVQVIDNGLMIETKMVAGSVGLALSSNGQALGRERGGAHRGHGQNSQEHHHDANRRLDTVQPVSGWWMYEVIDKADAGKIARLNADGSIRVVEATAKYYVTVERGLTPEEKVRLETKLGEIVGAKTSKLDSLDSFILPLTEAQIAGVKEIPKVNEVMYLESDSDSDC